MNKKHLSLSLLILIAVLGATYLFILNLSTGMVDDELHEDGVVESYEIYPGDVVDKIKNKENIVLLDVRTSEEYRENHLENALLLPVQELSPQSLANIGLGEDAKDKEIVIYCRSGARSKTAYDIMKSLGYTNIKSIAGGMVHWEEDGYPFTEVGAYTSSRAVVNNDGLAVDESGPKVLLNRTAHDFGDVPQSQGILSTAFTIQNIGDDVLTIGNVSTSCGCTTAELSDSTIDPNGTAIITVYFDPNFHEEPSGKITRTVFIPTNDPRQSEVEVKIMVDILEGR